MAVLKLARPLKCETLFLAIIIICLGRHPGHSQGTTKIKSKHDTIYFLTFLDFVRKPSQYDRGRFETKYDLHPEKDVMDKVIKKQLRSRFTMLPLPDSCYNSKIDSISRRKMEFLDDACVKCSINKKVIVLDAVWEYLDKYAMFALGQVHRSSGTSPSFWIIGTWWDVHSFVYLPKENKFLIHVRKKYTRWRNPRPVKWWPGVGHVRFFKRPIREVRKFLIEQPKK